MDRPLPEPHPDRESYIDPVQFDRERNGRWTDYAEPPPGMKPVINNPDWPGYLSRGNWTYDTPYPEWMRALVLESPRKWGQSRMPSLLRFPGWHPVGAGARVYDAGTDPDWPDHTHPFVD